jgi:hypothetical protein
VWYHLAAVGDVSAGTLTLYVDGSPVGSASGYDGLFVPAENNGWTIGRGQYYGYVADKVTGYIDEVRITAGALAPGYFLCVFNPDFDDDGLVDAWEREHFGNLDQVASGDPDKDGLTNEEEQNNDTDPTVSNAPYLGLTLEQGLLHFSWPVDSTGWVLEYRTNLVGVSPGVGWTAVPGSAATNLFSIPMDSVSGNKAFFHLREPE